MFGEKRVEKKKTPVYKCNLNPIFNAAFEFDVPWEQIRDCALDVQVMDFDTVGRNELIGKLTLGCEYQSRAYCISDIVKWMQAPFHNIYGDAYLDLRQSVRLVKSFLKGPACVRLD